MNEIKDIYMRMKQLPTKMLTRSLIVLMNS